MTKKFFSLLLILASVFSMTSCITDEPDEPDSDVVVPNALIGTWKVVESQIQDLDDFTPDPDPLIDETITITSSKIIHSRKLANGKTVVKNYEPKVATDNAMGATLSGYNEEEYNAITIVNVFNEVHANIGFPTNLKKFRYLTLQRVN